MCKRKKKKRKEKKRHVQWSELTLTTVLLAMDLITFEVIDDTRLPYTIFKAFKVKLKLL